MSNLALDLTVTLKIKTNRLPTSSVTCYKEMLMNLRKNSLLTLYLTIIRPYLVTSQANMSSGSVDAGKFKEIAMDKGNYLVVNSYCKKVPQ